MIDLIASPRAYVEHLAGYISNPSTIRVRTLEQFGRAPSLETCREIRMRVEDRRRRKQSEMNPDNKGIDFTCGHSRALENCKVLFDGTVECKTCAKALAAKLDQAAADRREEERQRQERLKERARRDLIKKVRDELGQYGSRPDDVTIMDLARFAAKFSGLPYDKVWNRNRNRELARIRFCAWSVAKEMGHSFPLIGRVTGGVNKYDHSSVINGVKSVRHLFGKDEKVTRLICALREFAGL